MAKATPISVPQPDPFNLQAVKHYVFNETGNIMLSSTDEKSDKIEQSVRDVFAEVAVFFSAMTKAITTTIDPHSNPPGGYYSIYNLDALQAIIDGSGCFIQVTEEDVSYTTTSFGTNFSKELIQALLGLATGSGELAFASAMVASIGNAGVTISGQVTNTTSKVANIVFVCEYLMGMPIVSAIVVSADATDVKTMFQVGPCFSEESDSQTLLMHKDTYMFVTPAFIKEYAGDLNSGMNDPAYQALIASLQVLLTKNPVINGVYDITNLNNPVLVNGGSALKVGTSYALLGEFLGSTTGTLALIPPTSSGSTYSISLVSWTPNMIKFTVSGTVSTAVSIAATLSDDKTMIQAPGGYTIASSS